MTSTRELLENHFVGASFSMEEGCGVGCAVIVILLIVVGVSQYFFKGCSLNFWGDSKTTEISAEKQAELERFARQEVPSLQNLIDEMTRELTRREESLTKLSDVFKSVGKNPDDDVDYRRWRNATDEIRQSRNKLIEQRTELFIAFKKFELAPTTTDRDEQLKAAEKTVQKASDNFQEMMRKMEDMKVQASP